MLMLYLIHIIAYLTFFKCIQFWVLVIIININHSIFCININSINIHITCMILNMP